MGPGITAPGSLRGRGGSTADPVLSHTLPFPRLPAGPAGPPSALFAYSAIGESGTRKLFQTFAAACGQGEDGPVRYCALMASVRRLTRKEAKEVTRQRLLTAALQILNERGETDVSASTVARAAGIAQPSFYE